MTPKITDAFRFLSKLSIQKIWNGAKVWFSFYVSKYSKRNFHSGFPISLAIEPTTSCNLRCPECPSGLRSFTRPTGMLPTQLFKKIIDELYKNLTSLTFYFQGEPYLHPNFTELVNYAHKKNIYTSTSTNAHFLDDKNCQKTIESGLDRLIISIDGTSQETYQAYRIGGKLEKVIEGTRNMLAWRAKLKSKTPYIIFQFLVVKPNEHQISEVQDLATKLGVDEVKFKTAQIYDYKNGSPLMPSIEKYARYRKNAEGVYEIKNSLENSCWRMWQSCVMTWDGSIVPCCFDKDAHHKLGNLENNSFAEIWQSLDYQEFRQKLLRSRSEIEMCKNCTEGTKVWA
ncbi:MAG: radical SAM protein [Bacteroidetes bacterium]|nr:MAG: radical SAM protein [Bacteroidota bacterium]